MKRLPPPQRGRQALIALLMAALVAGCDKEMANTEPPLRPIAWAQVQPFSGTVQRTLPGVVRAAQRAEIGFEVPGRVAQVAVEIGETFAAGEPLARIDDRSYRLAVEERRGDLAEARARLSEAGKTLARERRLLRAEAGSQAQFDSAQGAFASLQGQVERLQARLRMTEKDLADTVLSAPYDGEVLARRIEPSQQVAAGETAFTVQGRQGGLEVGVSVPETVVDRLEMHSRQRVRFPARPRTELDALVTEIGAGATDRNAFPVTLALADAPAKIRPGMTAEVAFSLSQSAPDTSAQTLMAIPASAFLAAQGNETVAFVFDVGNGTVSRRRVVVDDISNGQALISSGLQAGEIVATKGLSFLADGQRVRRMGVGTRRYNP